MRSLPVLTLARPLGLLAAVLLLLPPLVRAQSTLPQVASFASLVTYPSFYHGRQIVVRGELQRNGSRLTLRGLDDAPRTIAVMTNEPAEAVDLGPVEVRGDFWDVGELKEDDPRIESVGLRAAFNLEAGTWPKEGEALVIMKARLAKAERAPVTTIRALVLNPERYDGQGVTVSGQYRARNLLGDLPRAPSVSRFDFVIRSGGAAIWVTGKAPEGKGFAFDLDSKIDTRQWLQVTGVVRRGRGLTWIEAGRIDLGKEQTDARPDTDAVPAGAPPPAAPPPEVLFSMPTDGETDVATTTSVKIQFSRDLDVSTIKENLRAGYVGAQAPGGTLKLTGEYDERTRVLEIKFAQPLERFRTVRIELGDGILGTDKQPLKPCSVTFSVGGP